MSPANSRAEAQYTRKRTVQACFTCRNRKSRCDGMRPKCGFCSAADSPCTYPGVESNKLDKGSVEILERIRQMEQTILNRLNRLNQGVASDDFTDQKRITGLFWPNGDIILTWKCFDNLVFQLPDFQSLCNFREQVRNSQATPDQTPTVISLTVQAKSICLMPSPLHFPEAHNEARPAHSSPAGAHATMFTDSLHSLLRSYILHVHSRSPILDVDYLGGLSGLFISGAVDYRTPNMEQLPTGTEASDVAIFLLVLSLGHIATLRGPHTQPIGQSSYVRFALPWIGLTAFSTASPVKNLQAELLLASYHMWTMNHWEAWCIADSMASKAEKLLLRYPNIIEDPLSHRVMWAVAKMQLELNEECCAHRPCKRIGKLTELISSTSLPQPPSQPPQIPFGWLEVDPDFESDTWYYFLAETSSRRLVERIKNELYSRYSYLDAASHLAKAFPVACELERHIEEWMNSLPCSFKVGSPQPPGYPSSAAAASTGTMKNLMKPILENRMRQLQMLCFRPFIGFLAEHQRAALSPADHALILRGVKKYIAYAVEFLIRQPKNPERHYGSWLLARNIWSAALTLVCACSISATHDCIIADQWTIEQSDALSVSGIPSTTINPINPGGTYLDITRAVENGCAFIQQWNHESRSLEICAGILSSLVTEIRQRQE